VVYRLFFTIEVGVTPNGQQAIANSATQNRQTFIGLKKSGVGQASIGTQYTTLHDAAAVTDPGQLNNLMGNVIYSNYVHPNSTTTNATLGNNAAANGQGLSYTIRSTNMLKFNSEVIAGFKGNAFYVMNNSNSTVTGAAADGITGGQSNAYGWGVGVDYTWKALALTANYQSFNQRNPYSNNTSGGTQDVTCTSASTPGSSCLVPAPTRGGAIYAGAGQGSQIGQNTKDSQQYYAATYDFGILKAYAQYVNRKIENQYFSSNYIQRSAQQIGVRSFVTPTVETWLSGGTGRYNAYGAGGAAANFQAWQVGGNYWLSKRTNLYAIYGAFNQSNASSGSAQGYQNFTQTAQTRNPVSANANNYAVGIRHTF